ncbi:MAG: hypothetical protein E6J69_07055 [Deltaproteobacteria bacterium]|nr:MAG: hypothetical protein E6J69_07055 [Deltaproteobacteria bacterium]
MTAFRQPPTDCDNMNHRRANSPVPHCPQCGKVVNREIPRWQCSDTQHAVARRQGSAFCVGCGAQLVVRRP